MIRGVNRQIIEVADTGSKYFERALLFVSSKYNSHSPDKLQREAVKVVNSFGQPPAQKRKRSRISRGALIGIIILLSLALTASLIANLC